MSAANTNIPPLPTLSAGTCLVDSHCHLDMDDYPDRRQVIARARAAGVRYIMSVAIDLASSEAAVQLAESEPGVYCSVGVHPHHVAEADDEHYRRLSALARHPKVKAYGEIGLDYVKDYAPKAMQLEHFTRQVALAKELELPLIVHDREAHADVMAILEAAAPFPAGGVMHCYSGDLELAAMVIELGFYLSIPGIVTYPKALTLHQVAREVPLDALLVETDGPYLTPVPYRGKRNEPAYALYSAARIAELRGIPLNEVARATTQNAIQLFALEAAP